MYDYKTVCKSLHAIMTEKTVETFHIIKNKILKSCKSLLLIP